MVLEDREVVSDGLAMMQILLLRRSPFVPRLRPGRLWLRLRPVIVLAGIGLVVGIRLLATKRMSLRALP